MLSSKDVNGWLYVLIGGSVLMTVLLTYRVLDTLGSPLPLHPSPQHLPAPRLPPPPNTQAPTRKLKQNVGLSESAKITRAVDKERELLKKELETYLYPNGGNLSSLTLETGGQPVRALVATTWRSGSTFLGDIMNSHPATFYHYEPLLHFDIHQARSGALAADAVNTLSQLMHCNYTKLNRYLDYGRQHHWLFSHNERLWKYCMEEGWRKMRSSYCWSAQFLNRFCPLFPFQSIKTVRMRLNLTKQLVEDPSLNVKVLLLVRDPRGTMQSRKHRDWCPGNPDCDNPALLCRDLVDDYHQFQLLEKEYPNRYKSFRYEDFSMNPVENTKEVFDFFGFSVHSTVTTFLLSHTKTNKGGVSSTFRDSKTAPFKWRQKLTMEEVKNIQDSCEEAMSLWGYARVEKAEDLATFSPVIGLKD